MLSSCRKHHLLDAPVDFNVDERRSSSYPSEPTKPSNKSSIDKALGLKELVVVATMTRHQMDCKQGKGGGPDVYGYTWMSLRAVKPN